MSGTLLLAIVAIGLIVTSTARFTSEASSSSKHRNRLRQLRDSDVRSLRQAAEIARLDSELQFQKSDGLSWRVMEVAEVVRESEDCLSFFLADPYRQPLPEFRPGQYLMVRPALAGAYQTTRCYSLSSAPNSSYWRITVKRQIPDGPAKQSQNRNGGLSVWLHETIHEGDCLLIGGPSGQFFLPDDSVEPSPRPLVLMAAGIGITPMASMLRWSLEHTPDRKVHLLYQAKDFEHWPLGLTLHGWKATFPTIEVHTFFSRASEKDVVEVASEFPGHMSVGRFSPDDAVQCFEGMQADFYMCGPDPWMRSLREGLIASGQPAEHVHWESFGGTGAQPTQMSTGDCEPVQVRFEASDLDAVWSDSEKSLWELARENDVHIPSGCLSGVCGSCRVKVLEGRVEHSREVSLELAENECLSCVARPATPVSLDV